MMDEMYDLNKFMGKFDYYQNNYGSYVKLLIKGDIYATYSMTFTQASLMDRNALEQHLREMDVELEYKIKDIELKRIQENAKLMRGREY